MDLASSLRMHSVRHRGLDPTAPSGSLAATARMQQVMVVLRCCDTRLAAPVCFPALLSGPAFSVCHSIAVAVFDVLPHHSSACRVAPRTSSAAAIVLPVAAVAAAVINRKGVWATSGGLW